MQTGPGFAIKDGSLGAPMATGPGMARRDGSLGAVMASGPGFAHRDGSLGGGIVATGPGHAYRDGSLGLGCTSCSGLGVSDVKLGDLFSMDLIIGAAVGALAAYVYFSSEKG